MCEAGIATGLDIWHTLADREVLAHKTQILEQHCAEVGRDPAQIEHSAFVGGDPREVGHECRDLALASRCSPLAPAVRTTTSLSYAIGWAGEASRTARALGVHVLLGRGYMRDRLWCVKCTLGWSALLSLVLGLFVAPAPMIVEL